MNISNESIDLSHHHHHDRLINTTTTMNTTTSANKVVNDLKVNNLNRSNNNNKEVFGINQINSYNPKDFSSSLSAFKTTVTASKLKNLELFDQKMASPPLRKSLHGGGGQYSLKTVLQQQDNFVPNTNQKSSSSSSSSSSRSTYHTGYLGGPQQLPPPIGGRTSPRTKPILSFDLNGSPILPDLRRGQQQQQQPRGLINYCDMTVPVAPKRHRKKLVFSSLTDLVGPYDVIIASSTHLRSLPKHMMNHDNHQNEFLRRLIQLCVPEYLEVVIQANRSNNSNNEMYQQIRFEKEKILSIALCNVILRCGGHFLRPVPQHVMIPGIVVNKSKNNTTNNNVQDDQYWFFEANLTTARMYVLQQLKRAAAIALMVIAKQQEKNDSIRNNEGSRLILPVVHSNNNPTLSWSSVIRNDNDNNNNNNSDDDKMQLLANVASSRI